MKIKIALLQIAPCGSLEENRLKGIESCKKAKEMGADIALFPEMFSNGYDIYNRPAEEWLNDAVDINSDFVLTFKKLANELNMAIGITLLEKYGDAPRNTFVLFDRFGNHNFTYAKVHTCDFSVESNFSRRL